MGCGGDREKQVAKEHQWDYFNLSDFKSSSCWAPFSYAILYITLGVSVACYVLDVLTCYQLLVFDNWSGQIKISPLVPFEVARWIFTGCILLSFLFLIYRWWKAIRAIKSGSVVASYLDPLAVRVQSIRMGQAQGWRRFLVFAELTKSKKGAEYVALFSYFSFEAALRIILAEGPRQVINGLTIYSILRSEIIPADGKETTLGHSPIVQFFLNVKALAQGNTLRAIVFFGMIFTVFIWVLAALSLASACILYIMFLWHHIPSNDGGLRGFCKRKVDGRLQKIVDAKVKKAFEREEKMRQKEEAKRAKAGQPIVTVKKQPTLPILTTSDDKLPDMPMLSRQPTFATLPEYESRPGTPLSQRPGMPSRTGTQNSNTSYTSNAPLLGDAASMGFSQPPRPYSPSQMSNAGSVNGGPPALGRSLTGQSQASQGSYGYGQRPMGPPRQGTNGSQMGVDRQFTPAPSMRSNTPMGQPGFNPGPPRRQNTGTTSNTGYNGSDRSDAMSVSSYGLRTPGIQQDQAIEMQYRPQPTSTPSNGFFRPYSPAASATGQAAGQSPRIPFGGGAQTVNSPVGYTSTDSFSRPYAPPRAGTAPPQNPYTNSNNNQSDGRSTAPLRSATAGPDYNQWPQHGL